MADFNVDVNLPSAISVDITSPTQALATNISIPGPQGPAGIQGPSGIVNTGLFDLRYYSITNPSGFISGNLSLYATTINLASTGANLNTSINNLSGLFTGYTGSLDATYATDSQLANTGSTLNTKIDNLSGYVNSQDTNISNNLSSTGSSLQTNINTLSSNLNSTGSNLENKITSLSGTLTSNYATITNLASTGSTLTNSINSLSGTLTSTYATINNLASTGSTLATNLASTGLNLDTKINALSGSSVLLYGDQSVGGVKTFRDNVYINNLFVTGTQTVVSTSNFSVQSPYLLLNLTGGAVDGGIFFVTGAGLTGINDSGPIIGFDHSNKFKFGVSTRNNDLSTLPDIASVQQIEAYSGVANNTFSTITNLAVTGTTLNNRINSLSGYVTAVDATFATIINLASTGSTLDSKINSLSGWSASAVNLASTGSTLNTRINNLSGYINSPASNIVFTTGNQTISGVKTFVENTTFGDSAQGDFLVISGNNFTVYGSGNFTSGLFVNSSPVLTGSSTLYATTVNLASTGSTLNTKINNLSGVSVLTFGDQTINGLKTFTSGIDIYSGTSPQSLRIFNKTGINTGEFGLIGWQNNTLVIGSQNTNSGTLRDIRLTGANINLSATGAVIVNNRNPVGDNSFIVKDGNGDNGVSFNPAAQGGVGLFSVNYISTHGIIHQGDYNLDVIYGGGGARNITFQGGSVFVNRAILDSNGNFGIGSGISSVPSRFYVSGDSLLEGNLDVSGMIRTPQQNKKFVYRPTVTGNAPRNGFIFYGANCTLTPKYVGTLRADASVSMNSTVPGSSTDTYQSVSFWYGTGTAPAYSGNLVNFSGQQIGGHKGVSSTPTFNTIGFPIGTSWVAEITGLNTGTQYWFDIGISGRAMQAQDVQIYIEEKY